MTFAYITYYVHILFSSLSFTIFLIIFLTIRGRSHYDRSKLDRSQFALRKCSHSFRSILDRSQFAFERLHSDRFGLRSISDRSNSLV